MEQDAEGRAPRTLEMFAKALAVGEARKWSLGASCLPAQLTPVGSGTAQDAAVEMPRRASVTHLMMAAALHWQKGQTIQNSSFLSPAESSSLPVNLEPDKSKEN